MNYKPRKRPRHPQPIQPLVWDGKVIRFQANAIVEFIVRSLCSADPHSAAIVTTQGERISYNDLMAMRWSDADWDQFNMLHGYSVSGLPYRSTATERRAELLAAAAIKKRFPKRKSR